MRTQLRTHVPPLLVSIGFVYVVIIGIDILVWGQVRWPVNVASAIEAGIGLYVALRTVTFPRE